MNGGRRGRERLRELQDEETVWRDRRPEWTLRFTLLDLITSCGLQYFADHALARDVELIEHAVAMRSQPDQRHTGSDLEQVSMRCVDALHAVVLENPTSDLDADDRLRRRLLETATRIVLGRDESASADLVVWNEVLGLAEGVSTPWRCVTQISAVTVLSGSGEEHRAAMTGLRDRFLRPFEDRAVLDDEVTEHAAALRRQLTES